MTKQQNITLPTGDFLLYQTEDGRTRIEVRMLDETVWLTQKQMAELFQKDVRTISEHIKNIIAEGELNQEAVVRNFRITASDGKSYDTAHYNLDVIISVGYRVKSTAARSSASGPPSGCGSTSSKASSWFPPWRPRPKRNSNMSAIAS